MIPDRPVDKMNVGLAFPAGATKRHFGELPSTSVLQFLHPGVCFQLAGMVAFRARLFLLETAQSEKNFCDMSENSEGWSRQQRSEIVGRRTRLRFIPIV